MKKLSWLVAALLLVALAAWFVQANGQEKAAPKKEYGYLGSKACMACHKNPEKGDQYGKWLASPHAKAYAALQSDAAKKIAADKGLKKPAEESPECIKCHMTGWNAKPELLDAKFDKTEGVGCEVCHGAAAGYKMVHFKEGGEAQAMTLGMIMPDEKLCKGCHNAASPTFKTFDFAKMSAMIAHPNPKKAAK
jgi:hypothetical protein